MIGGSTIEMGSVLNGGTRRGEKNKIKSRSGGRFILKPLLVGELPHRTCQTNQSEM